MSLNEPDTDSIACLLSTADRRRREDSWQSVISTALRDKRAIEGGVRLEFEPTHAITHLLTDLVSAERECCPWAAWTLLGTSTMTVVEVTANGDGTRAARELFGLS